MVKSGYMWMGCCDCHKYNGRRWIWSVIHSTTTCHQRSFHVRCTELIDNCCVLYFTSSELRTDQVLDTHLHPTTRQIVVIRRPQPVDSLFERLYFTEKKLGSIYIHVFKEITSNLHTCVQRTYTLFINTCSKKLGPMYMHVFKEIRPYLYVLKEIRPYLYTLVQRK